MKNTIDRIKKSRCPEKRNQRITIKTKPLQTASVSSDQLCEINHKDWDKLHNTHFPSKSTGTLWQIPLFWAANWKHWVWQQKKNVKQETNISRYLHLDLVHNLEEISSFVTEYRLFRASKSMGTDRQHNLNWIRVSIYFKFLCKQWMHRTCDPLTSPNSCFLLFQACDATSSSCQSPLQQVNWTLDTDMASLELTAFSSW